MAVRKKTNGLGAMLIASTAAHLVLYFVLSAFYFPHEMKVTEQVCYVDMVNLPVASPQQGSPAGAQAAAPPQATPPHIAPPPATPAAKTPAQPAAQMTLPSATKGRKTPATDEGAAADYNKRLAQLEEQRHLEEAMARLQKRGTAPSAAPPQPLGIPTGTGTQAGSDYPSYVQSRLKDAFDPQVSSGKKPKAEVELRIDRFGITWKFVRPSGDKLFDDSVERAIKAAQKNIPSPPGGGEFRHTFIFRPEGSVRPEGVGKK